MLLDESRVHDSKRQSGTTQGEAHHNQFPANPVICDKQNLQRSREYLIHSSRVTAGHDRRAEACRTLRMRLL